MMEMHSDKLIALLVVTDDDSDLGQTARTPWRKISSVGKHVRDLYENGVKNCKLFVKIPHDKKDLLASEGLNESGLMARTIREIRDATPGMHIAPEVCACAYSSEGECVIVDEAGARDDEATWDLMGRMALVHAAAGADRIVAGLTHDGSIQATRNALDRGGYQDCKIIGSIQFNSMLYAPYREMMGTEPRGGETHRAQISPGNMNRAIELLHQFHDEGAEYFVLQPAMTNVHALARLRHETPLPLYAFSVSAELPLCCDGDYNLIEGKEEILLEYYNSLLQAGADKVQSYLALPFARWLNAR